MLCPSTGNPLAEEEAPEVFTLDPKGGRSQRRLLVNKFLLGTNDYCIFSCAWTMIRPPLSNVRRLSENPNVGQGS